MRRSLWFMLLAAFLLVPQILSAGPAPAQRGTPPPETGIQALLERRADAVTRKDRAAFMSTAGGPSPGFVQAQGEWFDRVAALPLGGYALNHTLDRWGEFTRRSDVDRNGGSAVVALVEERYRIEGYDEAPVINDLYLTFSRTGGEWKIVSDTDVEDLGLRTARHLWDFGPMAVRESEHFMMLSHLQDAGYAAELLPLAESALPAVDEVWTLPWNKKVPIVVPHDRAELEALLGSTLDVTKFVAFATTSVDRSEGWRLTGPRIVINRQNFARYGAATARTIFVHELLHVANRSAAGPFIVSFVDEGLAELASSGEGGTAVLDAQVRAGRFQGRLPRDSDFVAGSPDDVFGAYQKALSAFLFLRSSKGRDAPVRFYEAYGRARVEPGTPAYHLDRALREVAGMSAPEFEKAWSAFARRAGRG